jgi:FkbM family methyltransferase
MDGITFSNTKFFEDELNWKGVLIEPTQQFNNLILNRPNCYNFNYAISEKEGEIDFLGHSAIGGILETMNEAHKKQWKLENNVSFKVKSIPLYKIINNLNIKKIDLFSIDVEGGELGILKTMNWNIPVYIVLIELDGHNKDKDSNCREILLNNGFIYNSRIGLDEVWINENNK